MSQRPGLSYREANRAALFSNPNNHSERSSPSSNSSTLPTHYPRDLSGYAANRTAEDLEGQNEEHLGQLSEKVKMLKNITMSIGNEVRESTKMLSGMNDSFTETGGILGGTMRRMNKMAKRQGGQWCWWMLFLILVTCIFFWTWLLR